MLASSARSHRDGTRALYVRALIRDIPCARSFRLLAPTPVLQVSWTAQHSRQTCQERRAGEAYALTKRPLRCELVHLLRYCFPMQCHTSSAGWHARSVRPRADPGHSLRSLDPPARTDANATGGLVRSAPTADMPERRAAEADALAKRLLRRELVHLPGHCFARQRHTSSVGWHARSVWARADQGFSPRSLARSVRSHRRLCCRWVGPCGIHARQARMPRS